VISEHFAVTSRSRVLSCGPPKMASNCAFTHLLSCVNGSFTCRKYKIGDAPFYSPSEESYAVDFIEFKNPSTLDPVANTILFNVIRDR
jgi:hypothetical protein